MVGYPKAYEALGVTWMNLLVFSEARHEGERICNRLVTALTLSFGQEKGSNPLFVALYFFQLILVCFFLNSTTFVKVKNIVFQTIVSIFTSSYLKLKLKVKDDSCLVYLLRFGVKGEE